jgi:hypothetical protein
MGYENLPEHDNRPEVVALFANLKAALPKLEELFAEYSGHSWEYEDRIYASITAASRSTTGCRTGPPRSPRPCRCLRRIAN